MADSEKLQIDVTNETAFKVGIVQTLQLLVDHTSCLSDMKQKVEKHERIVQVGKYAAVPAIGLFNIGIKAFFHKLGWWS